MKYKISEKYIEKVLETESEYCEWFGYYNYDVLSRDETKMLCNRATFDGRAITGEDKIDLGYYDLPTKEWIKIGETDSFNWQQGAMLQWLPGDGNENKVIYNFSDKKKFYSRIYDVVTKESKVINYPIYGIMPDGKSAIALNYERSYWCRAYHYQSVVNPELDVQVDENDGVFKVDLENDTVERIISIQDVIQADSEDDFQDAKHWIEHVMISPSGKRLVFLHRYSYGQGYLTRLMIANADGTNLETVPGWRGNDWSHFGWNGDDEFVIYSVKKSASTAKYIKESLQGKNKFSLRRMIGKITNMPVLKQIKNAIKPKRSQYYLAFKCTENGVKEVGRYDDKLFEIDGHPSFTNDGAYMITDSYPDKKGNQRLMVYNVAEKKVLLLGEFFAAFKGNPASCDLHPKLAQSNNYVAVDTAYAGKHKMILFSIKWDAIKEKIG